jgi:NitT/TauT family transport system substrate-binding protein
MSGEKLRIGFLSTAYHTSHILKELKLLKAEWKLFGTGPEIVRAFEDGKIDLAYIGLPPAIIGMERGVDIVCIAGGHVEGTVIAGRGRSYLEMGEDALKQLNGKRVGVPSKGSIHDVILRGIAENLDFKIVNYPWADFILEDFVEGKLDAVCGTPSLAVLALKFGAEILAPPDALWSFNPSYGIVVRDKLVKEEFLMDFLIKHEWACEFMKAYDSSSKVIFNTFNGLLSRDDIRRILEMSPKYCASLPEEYVDSTMRLARVMQKLEYLSGPVKEKDIFDREVIELVHPQPHHYRR